MKDPKSFVFSDVEFTKADLVTANRTTGVIPTSWTRVQFSMPSDWTKMEKVKTWLVENVANEWSMYDYQAPAKMDRIVVVKFKDRTDALMFKLRGGHQIWQDNEHE